MDSQMSNIFKSWKYLINRRTVPQMSLKMAKSQIFGNDDFEMKNTEYDHRGPKE